MMKIKMIGFKVGKSRPTANITIDLEKSIDIDIVRKEIGKKLITILEKSDFISIRRIEEK